MNPTLTDSQAFVLASILQEVRQSKRPENNEWDSIEITVEALSEILARNMANPDDRFCDSHCVWTDHHPDCPLSRPVQPAEDDMKIVGYQYQWTNPADDPDSRNLSLEWELVVPRIGQTEQERRDELLAYRYTGKPVYRVLALYAAKETV